ncbi:hypothetical protein BN1708_020703, partial [Verticillium longisporum]
NRDEPLDEQYQVHEPGPCQVQRQEGEGDARLSRHSVHDRGYRYRHRGGGSQEAVPALQPGRCVDCQKVRRHRSRPDHLQEPAG